jgi:hypothetical protein
LLEEWSIEPMLQNNTFKQPPRPLRNKQPAVDIAGFFDLLQQAFAIHVKTLGTPEGVVPIFVETFPKERLTEPDTPFNVITYRISNSIMAPTGNDGRTPRAPSIREVKQSEEKSNYLIQVDGWWEQVIVTFEIWCRDNADANKLVIWFHNFMMTWAFTLKFFEGHGINNFAFVQRLEDTAPRTDDQELYLRQLSYTFRLETLVAFEQRKLTAITLYLDGLAPINLPEITTT